MKAAIVKALGQTPVFGDFAEPLAGPAEDVIEVLASGLSPLTRGRASGSHYSAGSQYPFVVGVDGVGRLKNGQNVYFLLPRSPFGGFAQKTVVAREHCLALPNGVDPIQAAAIANPGMSSWAALTERARFCAGETVLINGATGASGQLAVQIARHLGAKKIVATGRNANVLGALLEMGANEVISLESVDDALERQFAEHFAQGVDVVLDYLWGPVAERMLRAAAKASPEAKRIRFVQIGNAAGGEIAFAAPWLRSSGLELMGSGLGSVSLPGLIGAIDGVFRAANAGALILPIKTMPLSEVEHVWNAKERERIVFLPD